MPRTGWQPATTHLCSAVRRLDECDGYVVLVLDPQTEELDAHGPHDGLTATSEADRLRREFDREGLSDVQVHVARLHIPRRTP